MKVPALDVINKQMGTVCASSSLFAVVERGCAHALNTVRHVNIPVTSPAG
jgi:hypothetical protein